MTYIFKLLCIFAAKIFTIMKNTIKIYIYNTEIIISQHNIHIVDSYLTTSTARMKAVLDSLREYLEDYQITMDNPLVHRTNFSMIREWVAHNNFYKLNIKRARVKDCDLNYPQKWYMKIAYFICGLIVL